ncbi:ClC family H(+)/Cl(-) exchange transporter [Veillonella caviae]|uniref:ClC family H(+)/Cl(-) exchange transporter n=2 Tax=Veillonella caviae TaxID=248316 RepID=UPI002A917EAF|nr:ClC family H(+)/Cl(-) exchange transporter [Veillonella caviae]MDY5254573.1 ClC family H(+)/Cl(-) exchange transporter [Veillonella caviae]
MKRWQFNKRSSTLADMSMNRVLLYELILKGALVGVIAGICGATYRYLILESEHWRWHMMDGISYEQMLIWLGVMVVFAFVVDKLLKWAPLSGGSGIPQIEGEMLGLFDMKPYRTLISKMIGGVITGFAGFSVGREGPAVQIGGSAGKIVSYWMHSGLREQRILTSAGAGAGLAAAFSAPVSGAMFVFEEVHKSFYPYLVVPTFVATLISNYITVSIFGLDPALGFTVTTGMPLDYFPVLLLVGVVMGLCGVFFCRMIFLFKHLFDAVQVSRFFKLVTTFVVVALIGFDSQLLLGGGNDLVAHLAFESHGVWLLLGIVIGKILLTTFCYGSGAQGGIFLPMLVIGAASGAFCESLFASLSLISGDFTAQFVICAMGGMLAAAMRTPILAILLVLEMTNSFSNIYAIGTVTIVAYLVAELLKEPPIYDSLLQAMTGQSNLESVQTFFQTKVPVVATYIDIPLQDLQLPDGTLIVSIRRNGTYIVPLGDVRLESGDELQVSCERGKLKEAKMYFQSVHY